MVTRTAFPQELVVALQQLGVDVRGVSEETRLTDCLAPANIEELLMILELEVTAEAAQRIVTFGDLYTAFLVVQSYR
jgi:hypothetical protein